MLCIGRALAEQREKTRVWGSSICGTEHSRGKNKTEKDRMHRNLHRGPLMSLAEYKPEHVNT